MTIIKKNTSAITRIYIDDLEDQFTASSNRDMASTILDYNDGDDIRQTQEKMAERFASEITRIKDSVTGEVRYNQVKTVESIKAAIKHNIYETIVRGMMRKVASNVATLIENSEFKFLSNGKPDEQFTLDIEESRKDAQFKIRMSRLEEMSVVIGSAVILVQVNDTNLQYQPIAPDKVWVIFGDEFTTNDKTFPIDTLNINHAQCIIIQIDDENFAAYFARSDKYPNGRFVQYECENAYNPYVIPEFGTVGANDYTVNDEPHNPLTYQQSQSGNYATPEYPVVVWMGTTQGIGKELIPVSTSMYDLAREIDLAASRIAMGANKSATGAWFFTTAGGINASQPASITEGVSKLEEGTSVNVLTVPSSNIQVASDINDKSAQYLAEEWGLNSYSVGVGDTNNMPSGVALMEANRPSVKKQKKRKTLNDSAMDSIFQIELALASIEEGIVIGDGVVQEWTLNTVDIFKTDMEILLEFEKQKALGVIDTAGIIMEIKGITREQAREYLATLDAVPVANTTANRLGI